MQIISIHHSLLLRITIACFTANYFGAKSVLYAFINKNEKYLYNISEKQKGLQRPTMVQCV